MSTFIAGHCSQQGQAGHYYALEVHILNNTATLETEHYRRTILLFLMSQSFPVNAEAGLVQLPHEGTCRNLTLYLC